MPAGFEMGVWGSVANLSSNEAKWVAGSENDDFLREVVLIPVATIVSFRG